MPPHLGHLGTIGTVKFMVPFTIPVLLTPFARIKVYKQPKQT